MNQLNLDFRYLKAFEKTAENLSFSKAARELGIAQSAVSRQVKLLEDSLGDQLIVRSSSKVLLSQKGESLFKEIQRFEKNVRHLFQDGSQTIIKVGILEGLLQNWFQEILIEFSKFRNYELQIDVNTLENLKKNLQQGHYDLIFTTENIHDDLCETRKLFDEKMILISKTKIDLKYGNQYPWIVYSPNDHLFKMYKHPSSKVTIVNSMATIINLVQRDLGIAVVPDHVVSLKASHVKIHELNNVPKEHVYLSHFKFQKIPKYLKDLIQLIERHKTLS